MHAGQLHALTEYMAGGTLESLVLGGEPLPWPDRVRVGLHLAQVWGSPTVLVLRRPSKSVLSNTAKDI